MAQRVGSKVDNIADTSQRREDPNEASKTVNQYNRATRVLAQKQKATRTGSTTVCGNLVWIERSALDASMSDLRVRIVIRIGRYLSVCIEPVPRLRSWL